MRLTLSNATAPRGAPAAAPPDEKDSRIHAALAVLEDAAGGSLEQRHKVAAMLLRAALRINNSNWSNKSHDD